MNNVSSTKRVTARAVGRRARALVAAVGLAFAAFMLISVTALMSAPPPAAGVTAPGAVVRHAPVVNGRVEGSVRQLTGEAVTLNSGAVVTGDLLVPGTPTVTRNGSPTFGGVVEGGGSAQPSGYAVTLNSSAQLGRLVTRMDAVSLPAVAPPPASAGTRSVVINSPGQSAGDFATLRDLTLNGNVGVVSVPPGTYRNMTANSGSGFALGVAGASQPAVYNMAALTINGASELRVVGPVVLTLGSGLNVNGAVGSTGNPLWLTLKVASGGVTLNGGSSLRGVVFAPSGTVTINGSSGLVGTAFCDRLIVNSGGVLQGVGDTAPPALSVLQPANGLTTRQSTVTLSGTVSDQSDTKVTVNGVPAALGANGFSVGLPLAEGVNTAQVVATDLFGNQSQVTLSVTRDTLSPALSVQQPAEGTVTREAQAVVTGAYVDTGVPTIKVNNVNATISGNQFSATIALAEGPNQLTVTAVDAAGNQAALTRNLTRDSAAPSIQIVQPAATAPVKDASVTVTGTVTDATAVTVSVNGVAAAVSGNTYSATVPLTEGSNTLQAVAVDAAGNQGVATRGVVLDSTAPTLNILKPTDGAYVKDVRIDGVVADATNVTVTVEGAPLAVADGHFTKVLTLPEGQHQLHFVATDAAGNVTALTRTVKVDTTAPVLSGVSPAQGSLINAQVVTVTGSATDAAPVTVTVDEVEASLGAGGQFTAEGVPLEEGDNELRVGAFDEAGNSAYVLLHLQGKDVTPPSAPSLFPFTSPTRLAFQTIEGHAEPGSSVKITGAVEPVTTEAADGTGLFIANVKLAAGANDLVVRATDGAGNDSPAVGLSITSDPNLAPPGVGQPAQINIASGNTQRTLSATELPRPLIAIVTDRTGAPVANVPVTFVALTPGGLFVGGSETAAATTDQHGYARVRFVAGADLGPQIVRANFSGNVSTPAEFTAEVLDASPLGRTSVSGVVLDQNLRALPNVLVRVGGQQTRSGADGRFRIMDVPAGPHQVMELVGRDQVALPGRWPNISYDMDVLPGVDNDLGRPLFLPKVNDGVAMPLSPDSVVTQDVVYELPVVGSETPIRVTAKAGTHVTFPPDATDKRLSVTRIATNRVPMVLEDGRATNLYISVQPSGALFEPPLEISFPNVDAQPANSEVLLMSFDHDAGRYVKVGTGHVSADGKSVTSDAGSGVRVGSWHALPPDPPEPEVTVLGHIQVEGNPAFEDKEIVSAEAWVEGTRAVMTTLVSPLSDAKTVGYRATFSLPPGSTAFLAAMQANVKAVKGKVKFVTPNGDPKSSPAAAGVGQNEFTYSVANPGVLEINMLADVDPPAALDAAFAQRVTFAIDNINGSVLAWDGANPGGRASINGAQLTARVTFTGLPANNADFGQKQVRVLLDGKVVGRKKIEVFYPRDATNHPGGVAGTPNWFYYWQQTGAGSPNTEYVAVLLDPLGNPVFGTTPKMLNWSTYAGPIDRVRVGPATTGSDPRRDGSAQVVTGIDLFANTLLHENRHVRQVNDNNAQPYYTGVTGAIAAAPHTGWSFNYLFIPPPAAPGGPPAYWNHFRDTNTNNAFDPPPGADTDLDPDRDDLATSLEPSASDRAKCATHAANGDIECQAELTERSKEDKFLKVDWGSPGKQHLTKAWND